MNDDRALLDQLLAEAGVELASETEPEPELTADPRGPHALSYSQEFVWRLDRASPGLASYNMPVVRRLVGPLDRAALARALAAVAARHDVLHTRFEPAGDGAIAVVDDARPFALRSIDLGDVAVSERLARASAIVSERALAPFDLAREHAYRATLIGIADDDHVLVLELHHIASDGVSVAIILAEIAECYRADRAGTAAMLPALELAYYDFARWQRAMLESDRYDESLAYWRRELAVPTEPLDFAVDGSADADVESAHRVTLELDPERTAALRAFARARNATPYMVLLAVFATSLHRYAGSTSFRVGSNVAARSHRRLESTVGYFNNTLAIRCDLAGEPSFDDVLARVRERCLGAYDNQDLPYEKLALAAYDAGASSASPLFNVVFSAEAATERFELAGLRTEPYDIANNVTKFDLAAFVNEAPETIRLTLYARARVWSHAASERFVRALGDLARIAVDQPTRPVATLPVLGDRERAILERCNATAVAFDEPDVLARIERWAKRTPEATALVCGETHVSYGALDARAKVFAERLRRRGAGPHARVGLAVERTPDAIAAFLGILAIGGIVVPFEPDLPAERIGRQLRTADARFAIAAETVVIADGATSSAPIVRIASDAGGAEGSLVPVGSVAPRPIRGDDIAYLIFTSGSTGDPKGVAVTHGNLANYTSAISRVIGPIDPSWHFGLMGTLAADLGYTALFPGLCAGATVHVVPTDVANDASRFRDYVRTRPLDVVKITPRHLSALGEGVDLAELLPARWTIVGGEVLAFDVAARIVATGRRLLNHYGPTETTVGATTFEVTETSLARARAEGARSVPIGFPLSNVRTFVRDVRGEAAPFGTIGELVIGGDGVAAGYYRRDDLTAERFAPDGPSGRTYRTGDRVRHLASGALEFVGRTDDQVKIRGYRVELGDIEAAFRAIPAVADAAVIVADSEAPPSAYVVLAGSAAARERATVTAEIVAALERRLPEYMVPRSIVVRDTLPRTPNGKLDRAAIAAETVAPVAPVAALHAARTETERALVEIWANVFGRDESSLGIADDFLALGGHSLVAIRILGQINRRFGVRLPLASVLEGRTIAALAARLDERLAAAPAAPELAPSRIPRMARPLTKSDG
ncbi:MAG: hypothetical protein NVSMB21_07420 [Vulcanimicrobiaceae bacterium]